MQRRDVRGPAAQQDSQLPPRIASAGSLRQEKDELMRQYRQRQDNMEEVSPLIEDKIGGLQQTLRNEVNRKSELETDLAHLDDLCSFMEEQEELIMRRGQLHREPLDAVAGQKGPLLPKPASSQDELQSLADQIREWSSHAAKLKAARKTKEAHLENLLDVRRRVECTLGEIKSILSRWENEVTDKRDSVKHLYEKFERARSLLLDALTSGIAEVPEAMAEVLGTGSAAFAEYRELLVWRFMDEFLLRADSPSKRSVGRESTGTGSTASGRPSMDPGTRPSSLGGGVGSARPSMEPGARAPSLGSGPGRPSIEVGARPPSLDVVSDRPSLDLDSGRPSISSSSRPGSQDELEARELKKKEGELQRKLKMHKEGCSRLANRCHNLGAENKVLKEQCRVHQSQSCDATEDSSSTAGPQLSKDHWTRENAKIQQQTKDALRSYKHVEALLRDLQVRMDETRRKMSEGKTIIIQRENQLAELVNSSSGSGQSFSFSPTSRVDLGVGEPSPEPPASTPSSSSRLRDLQAKVIAAEEDVTELRNELKTLQIDEKQMSSPSGKGALWESNSPSSTGLRDELRTQAEAADQARLEVEQCRRDTAAMRGKLSEAWETLGSEKNLKMDAGDVTGEHKRLKAEQSNLKRECRKAEQELEMLMLQSIGSSKIRKKPSSDDDRKNKAS